MTMSKCKAAMLFVAVCVVLVGSVVLVIEVNRQSTDDDGETTGETETAADSRVATIDASGGTYRSTEECALWMSSHADAPVQYKGKLGARRIAVRETMLVRSGERVMRNAFWLTGGADDAATMRAVRERACVGEIPVVVVRMRPADGLHVAQDRKVVDHYKPATNVSTWGEYDRKLRVVLRGLAKIPAVVVLEPDLLMLTFDSSPSGQQWRWMNEKYEEEFLRRVVRVVNTLKKSWVYIDAGNAMYLESSVANIVQMSQTLSRVPGLRGFAINTMHFMNNTYTEFAARKIHCRTGLHYIVDTSRNRGKFTKQPLEVIERCIYDPPNVEKGQDPGWAWGSRGKVKLPFQHRTAASGDGVLRSVREAVEIVQDFRPRFPACARESSITSAQDATVWLKTPGESDGRLYEFGSFHPCLMGHNIPCDDVCPMLARDFVAGGAACGCD